MGERAPDRSGVEKLGVDNYPTWSVYMAAHLMAKDLWQFVEKQPPVPPVEGEREATAAKWEAGRNKAWAEVTLHVEPMHLPAIMSCNGDVQAVWKYFKQQQLGGARAHTHDSRAKPGGRSEARAYCTGPCSTSHVQRCTQASRSAHSRSASNASKSTDARQ